MKDPSLDLIGFPGNIYSFADIRVRKILDSLNHLPVNLNLNYIIRNVRCVVRRPLICGAPPRDDLLNFLLLLDSNYPSPLPQNMSFVVAVVVVVIVAVVAVMIVCVVIVVAGLQVSTSSSFVI